MDFTFKADYDFAAATNDVLASMREFAGSFKRSVGSGNGEANPNSEQIPDQTLIDTIYDGFDNLILASSNGLIMNDIRIACGKMEVACQEMLTECSQNDRLRIQELKDDISSLHTVACLSKPVEEMRSIEWGFLSRADAETKHMTWREHNRHYGDDPDSPMRTPYQPRDTDMEIREKVERYFKSSPPDRRRTSGRRGPNEEAPVPDQST